MSFQNCVPIHYNVPIKTINGFRSDQFKKWSVTTPEKMDIDNLRISLDQQDWFRVCLRLDLYVSQRSIKKAAVFFYICQCWIPVRCRDPRMCVGTNTPYSIYTRVRLKPEFWEIHQNLVATLLVSNFPSPLLPTQYNSLWEVLKESFRKTLKLSGTPAQFRIYSHEGLLSKNLINLLLTLVL